MTVAARRGSKRPLRRSLGLPATLEERALAHGADASVTKGALDWGELRPEILKFAGPPQTQEPRQ